MRWEVASAILLGVVLAGANRGAAAEIPKCAGLQGFQLLERERQVQQNVQPKPIRLHPRFPRPPRAGGACAPGPVNAVRSLADRYMKNPRETPGREGRRTGPELRIESYGANPCQGDRIRTSGRDRRLRRTIGRIRGAWGPRTPSSARPGRPAHAGPAASAGNPAPPPGYSGFFRMRPSSPMTPRRKVSTQTTKMTPWTTVTQAPSCTR